MEKRSEEDIQGRTGEYSRHNLIEDIDFECIPNEVMKQSIFFYLDDVDFTYLMKVGSKVVKRLQKKK